MKIKTDTPKQKIQELWEFIKVMSDILFSGFVIAAGAYCVIQGLRLPVTLHEMFLVSAGIAAGIKGLEFLYQAVMRK